MATKLDKSSSVEPRHLQSTTSGSTSATVSASSPKVSMFGAKSGFVIPKNKLSGSLIPIFRGGAKAEARDVNKEETTKQVQRKTKWGPDLTQDAAVRKGRALAYQIRAEQITKQLTSQALEIGEEQVSQSPKRDLNIDSATDQNHNEPKVSELLELEKREAIGEILHLNPSYKAPPDYKPLLKEAKVPVPIKSYPAYNFIGLLLGPENKTQKRLEEETGAKIRVYGMKAETGEKREITQSDINEAQGAYEELHVNVSADTYEKVDAAVALIELLLTPVAGNAAVATATSASGPGTNANIVDSSKDTTSIGGVLQPMSVLAQSGPSQFQPYPVNWYPVAPPNAPLPLLSGFMPPPMPSNSMQFPSSPAPPFNVPPFFGRPPPPPFSPVPRPSTAVVSRPQSTMQVMQQPSHQGIPPQNQSVPVQQIPPAYPVMPSAQPIPTGTIPATRLPSVPLGPEPRTMAPMGPVPNRPTTAPVPSVNSSGWSPSPQLVTPSYRPNSMSNMAPPSVPMPGRPPVVSPAAISPTPTNVPPNVPGRPPAANFAPPHSFSSRPSVAPHVLSSIPQPSPVSAPAIVSSSSIAPMPTPVPGPRSLHPQVPSPVQIPVPTLPVSQTAAFPGVPSPVSARTPPLPQSAAQVMGGPPVRVPSLVPGLVPRTGRPPMPSPQPSPSLPTSGNMPSFSPVKPTIASTITPLPVIAPKPHPSSSDFTFQPLKAQVSAPRSDSPVQTVSQSTPVPPAAPQPPSFRPALPNPTPPAGTLGFPRPPAVSLSSPPQGPIRAPSPPVVPLPNNPTSMQPSPRFQAFSNPRPVPPMDPGTQMLRPTISPVPRAPNLPVHPSNMVQPHQSQLTSPNRPTGLTAPNQQLLGNNLLSGVTGKLSSSPARNQIYDPFSPTSISSGPPRQGDDQMKARKPETDAEYEDLMASVGVR